MLGFYRLDISPKLPIKNKLYKKKNTGEKKRLGKFSVKKKFFFNDIHVTFGPEGICIHISYTHGLKRKRKKKEAWLFSLHILKRSSASPPNDKGTLFKCGQLSFEVTT
jgi:hypothetical protein